MSKLPKLAFVKKYVFIMPVIIASILIISLVFIYEIVKDLPLIKTLHLNFQTTVAKRGTIKSQDQFDGKIDSDEHVVLQFQQIPTNGGTIGYIGVKVGDIVKKGQLIASLDQQQMSKQQQLNLTAYNKQRAIFDQAISDNGGRTNYNDSLSDTQKRTLLQNQADLDTSVLNIEQQQKALDLSSIVTPIDGIVTRVDTPKNGVNILAPDEARFEVVNPTNMYFNVGMAETDIINYHVGDKGFVVLNAFSSENAPATIYQIAFAPHLDSDGNALYTIKVALDNFNNSSYKYKMGMTGKVVFFTLADNIVYVDNNFIHQDDKGSFVKVGNARKVTYINTGITDGLNTEVISGLSEGDVISY